MAVCDLLEGKKRMIARLRTQHLASPGYRARERGRMWARETANYLELRRLYEYVHSFCGEDEAASVFENYHDIPGLGALLFVFKIRPETYGDREAVVKFWRSLGYKTPPVDAEVQVFADWALEEWKAVKGEV